jgi:two-component system response regulator PilR (NtrC family)
VPVNCGAISPELMEGEFFGHRKGSFTGAVADKDGLFQAARGGTLFLDEVADLPLAMQVKLLRAIQERAVRPVGGHAEESVDVRILSASHKDLAQLVAESKFRQDLYFRINVITLRAPPLRERPDDIQEFAANILARLAVREGGPARQLARDALDALRRHPFPGNVRELENLLERACALCEGDVITVQDVDLHATEGLAQPLAPYSHDEFGADDDETDGEDERAQILKALDETRWNRSEAARRLGMTLRQLRYRLQKWGME